MLEQYKTVLEGGEGEIIEKKSRFIATVRPVEKEEEALSFIEEMRKKYWDATHNCYAYVIGERQEVMRCSDDGEPGGTAGKPMLDVLLGAIDYNPNGYSDWVEKHTMLSRLLPFIEPRVNLVELAPKGTGKSYLFGRVGKYGWLVSGGTLSRAKMFFDKSEPVVDDEVE